MSVTAPTSLPTAPPLSLSARRLVLAMAFLGWLFAGVQMAIVPQVNRSATIDFLWPDQSAPLSAEQSRVVQKWFAFNTTAFLLGAAVGGLLFGWLGDRLGRAKAMGASILCYSGFTGLCYFARSPEQFIVLRFLCCLGVGGTWPNGIAIVSEAWSDVSRPLLAGLIGAAANVGITAMAILSINLKITPDEWRWVLVLGASPFVLGLLSLASVPESPQWRVARGAPRVASARTPVAEVFRPPLLYFTLIGICLGAIPLLGGWGSGNWLIPWADDLGALRDPHLKGWTQFTRSLGGTISSLLGGWLAGTLGRKRSYFLISLGSLAMSAYVFNFLTPLSPQFPLCAFLIGLISGFYFGWLPLCLPELFPTRVRSTGAGVTFNFGRVATAVGVVGAWWLIQRYDTDVDYGRVGALTSLVYALGMIVIWFAPDTSGKNLAE